ncbi:MAG: hypothetical protein C0403_15500 [Desulfobacterium sp.]|nr:hypothetical protein [Desulfobacterium sp.]
MKAQVIHHIKLETYEMAGRKLFQYLEMYYNRKRKHPAIDWKVPDHSEQ